MPDDVFDNPDSNPFDLDQDAIDYGNLVDDIEEQDYEPQVATPRFNPEIKPRVKPTRVIPQRLTVWAIACAFIPTVIVAGFAYQINHKSLRDAARQTQEFRAIAIADSINNSVLRQYEDTKNLSQELGLISGLPPASQRQLISDRLNTKLKNPTNLTSGFAIYTPQGNLILQTSPNQLTPTLDRAVLKKVLDFNSSVINQPVAANNKYLIQFVAPIRDPKTQKIQAILVSQIPVSDIPISSTTGNYALADLTTDANNNLFLSIYNAESSAGKPIPTNIEQSNFIVVPMRSLQGLPDLKWQIGLIFEEPTLNYTYATVLAVGILVLVIAIAIISYLAARKFSSRLIQVSNTIRAIAEGKSHRPFITKGNDEIDQLLANVHLISEQLQIENTATNLNQEHKNSTAHYQQLLQEMEAQATQNQVELMQKNHQIQLLTSDLAQKAAKFKDIGNQIQVLINQPQIQSNSLQNPDLMISQINQLEEAAERISERIALSIKKMEPLIYSAQIPRIVDLVHEIGIEANLLSVNAGIKANRDHEFRVFAEQLSKLANSSVSVMQELENLAANQTEDDMGNLEVISSPIVAGLKVNLLRVEEEIKLKSAAESQLYSALSVIAIELGLAE
jgi:methyl-accepting chemotaxis protein